MMADGLAKTFGRRVRALRKSRGLTQEQLGSATGLDYKYVGNLERGERTPSFEAIERLADALKVDHYQLFLPDRFSADLLEQSVGAVLADLDQVDRGTLERFFRDILSAVRRLESAKR